MKRHNNYRKRPDETVYDLFPNLKQRKYPLHKIQECLIYSFINEAAMCLEDNILFSPRDGDIGAILGLGFPPLTGGSFRHIDKIGLKEVIINLKKLEKVLGIRFKPANILIEMSGKNKKFYE